MTVFLVKWAIQFIVKFLLVNVSFDQVLRFIDDAEDRYDNNMEKRGYVYRAIQDNEGKVTPQSVVNAVLELSVYYWKNLNK